MYDIYTCIHITDHMAKRQESHIFPKKKKNQSIISKYAHLQKSRQWGRGTRIGCLATRALVVPCYGQLPVGFMCMCVGVCIYLFTPYIGAVQARVEGVSCYGHLPVWFMCMCVCVCVYPLKCVFVFDVFLCWCVCMYLMHMRSAAKNHRRVVLWAPSRVIYVYVCVCVYVCMCVHPLWCILVCMYMCLLHTHAQCIKECLSGLAMGTFPCDLCVCVCAHARVHIPFMIYICVCIYIHLTHMHSTAKNGCRVLLWGPSRIRHVYVCVYLHIPACMYMCVCISIFRCVHAYTPYTYIVDFLYACVRVYT